VAGPAEARELDEALDAVAVGPVRLEELRETVVVDLLAGEGPADVLGDVVVPEAHRVGVAVGAEPDLGARPDADARQGAQAAVGLVGGQGDGALE
jgi:hypothetical protein